MVTHSSLDPPNFTVTNFIKGCFRSGSGRPDAAADLLRKLLASDVVWTDGSVPLSLGSRKCRYPSGLQKMLILLMVVLPDHFLGMGGVEKLHGDPTSSLSYSTGNLL